MSDLLLIPSATLIASELQGDFGRIPSCMVPLGGVPVLQRILDQYHGRISEAVVAAHAHAEVIFEYLANHPFLGAEAREVGATTSLGASVLRALAGLETGGRRLVIHFGDTLAEGLPASGDGFLYACPEDTFRWTTFRLEADRLGAVFDKGIEKESREPARAFVGVFAVADAPRFAAALDEAVVAGGGTLDPFYVALIRYYNEGEARPLIVEASRWQDLGHLDNYYAARLSEGMGQREFNRVEVDADRGILSKRSRNEEKFTDEIRWYLDLPPSLAYLAPRVFGHSLEGGALRIDLEYYGYPPLSDVFLYSHLDLVEWNSIFRCLRMVLDDMRRHGAPPVDPAVLGQSLRTMYLEKTLERLGGLQSGKWPRALLAGPLRLNGQRCFPLQEVLELLPGALEAAGLLEAERFSVIHGDFCLSNILFDRRSRTIRLVDPRGRFGCFGIHGDPRYDVAKLSHCFNGGYDFLVHGLFHLEEAGEGDWHLKVSTNLGHRAIQARFVELFLPDQRSRHQVRAIEALLFLSMVPLHGDRPKAQLAFLLRGLELATSLLLTAGAMDGDSTCTS